MLFNSLTYFIFLTIVFLLYWYPLRKNRIGQNVLLLVASYVFYGWWDWRFLSLMFVSSLLDFWTGIRIHDATSDKTRKYFLWLSLAGNLGMLGFFKYYNFFIDSFVIFSQKLGFTAHIPTLQIILPVGISFYTFQTMSYSIDIYRRQMAPTRDPVAFFAFVSFFPQLVAGPIERASALLPQFERDRSFDLVKAKDGLRQILYGLVKKIVIADTLGQMVDGVFSTHSFTHLPGPQLWLIMIFFTIQLYCDFSGYSDIAIGTARLFGFRLMRNFAFPFFSRNMVEFWQRWHISLTSWFRDYVFQPLGGRTKTLLTRNILITYGLSGLWHGASWNYVTWGFLHGLYFIPLIFLRNRGRYKHIVAHDRILPPLGDFFQMLLTFSLCVFSLILFRTPNMQEAMQYISSLPHHWTIPLVLQILHTYWYGCVLVAGLLLFEWVQRRFEHPFELTQYSRRYRWVFYFVAMILLLYLGSYETNQQYIYFQF